MINAIMLWPQPSDSGLNLDPEPKPNAVVFVHGIFNKHMTFDAMHRALGDPGDPLPDTDFYYFDYQYGNAIATNGEILALELLRQFPEGKRNVTLICHSMGGLVARLAILQKELPCIKTVFLLGTPNFGAISTAQLGMLTQMIRATTGIIAGLFIRKPGVTDLTKAYSIVQKYSNNAQFASEIDYVSIPGCYFHEQRSFFGPYAELKADKVMFATLGVAFSLLGVVRPLMSISMKRPHDGIVEERSNCLVPAGAGRWSEKSAALTYAEIRPRRYYHVQLKACEELIHTAIQSSPDVISRLRAIVLEPDLDKWRKSLTEKDLCAIDLNPPG